MNLQEITVLGSGTMGSGIAQVAATAGFKTTLYDIQEELLAKALKKIQARLERSVSKGRLDAEQARLALARLVPATELSAALAHCDYLIEAVPEKLALKQELFQEAEKLVPPHTILGSNTSTMMISAIGACLQDKSRLIGIHFFNPVPAMPLIEVVMSPDTSDAAYQTTLELGKRLGKETVRVNESPGFATSRINALIGNEAFRMLEEGVASAEDIDKALKLGLKHPLGPFEMVDLVGLDARLNNLRSLHAALGETYRPARLLEELVAEGRLGRKVGRGVYRYDQEGRRIPDAD